MTGCLGFVSKYGGIEREDGNRRHHRHPVTDSPRQNLPVFVRPGVNPFSVSLAPNSALPICLSPWLADYSLYRPESRFVGVSAPGSRVQHSSINAPTLSISSRYSAVASVTACGGTRPSFCQDRQPSTAHRKMPARSDSSFSGRVLSCSESGMVTSN